MSYYPISRVCSACGVTKLRDDYSLNQWKKGVGGGSKCLDCLGSRPSGGGGGGSGGGGGVGVSSVLRENSSTTAQLCKGGPFARGSHKLVQMGTYTNGPRAGQKMVCKWMLYGLRKEAAYFDSDMDVATITINILHQFANLVDLPRDLTIRFNKGEMWTRLPRPKKKRVGGTWVKPPPRVSLQGQC